MQRLLVLIAPLLLAVVFASPVQCRLGVNCWVGGGRTLPEPPIEVVHP